jgi:Legionella pneumophila major outer membrane protein precursor
MVRTTRIILILIALVSARVVAPDRVGAQEPGPKPPVPPVSSTPVLLDSLPRVPDLPGSLLQPAPPQTQAVVTPERPYFIPDPLLDPPHLPPVWFFEAEAAIVSPHVKNQLVNTVANPSGTQDTVRLPSAGLDWTVAPSFEVGRRLPAGFGEFSFAYRFLDSNGNGTNDVGNLSSRLDVEQFDFSYGSREFSLWPHGEMKVSLGLRLATVFFDSHGNLTQSPTDLGTAFQEQVSNHFTGFGPRIGLELAHRLEGTGFSLAAKIDASSMFGRVHQNFSETVTTGGGPVVVAAPLSSSTAVPTANLQLGISWTPPGWQAAHLFAGYQYEHWWNVGRLSKTDSKGDLFDQGVVLRAGIDY